jgi:hypothetical protein
MQPAQPMIVCGDSLHVSSLGPSVGVMKRSWQHQHQLQQLLSLFVEWLYAYIVFEVATSSVDLSSLGAMQAICFLCRDSSSAPMCTVCSATTGPGTWRGSVGH